MTQEAQHTPGPWRIKQSSANGNNFIYPEGSEDAICGVRFHLDFDAHEANARLIAAAPDLLEAVEVLLGGLEAEYPESKFGIDFRTQMRIRMNKARAAIAKARGQK